MNILALLPLYPPSVGGLQSHVQQLYTRLAAQGHTITILTPQLHPEAPEEEHPENNLRILRFPAWEIIPNYPLPKIWKQTWWHMWRTARQEKPDLVTSHTRFFSTALWGLATARYLRIPYMHIEHGSDFVNLDNPLYQACAHIYDVTIGTFVLRHADIVIAISQAAAVFVQKLGHRAPTAIIYRGIDTDTINNSPPNTQLREQNQNKVIIAYLGRLIDGKGVPTLLKALTKIQSKNYVCIIIGDGPQKPQLQKLVAQLNLETTVRFHGEKTPQEVAGILKVANMLINPSYTEGLPTAVIEAALCTTAIIATNVGGTPEIIEDTISGYLVPPRNEEALAEKIETLINNPTQRATFAQAAYEENKDRFAWKTSIEKYEKILTGLQQKSKTSNQ